MQTQSLVPIRSDRLHVGVDIGKAHHWVCVVDQNETRLRSKKVDNAGPQIRHIIEEVDKLGLPTRWAADIIGTLSALLLALLTATNQTVSYASGRVVSAMRTAYPGEGKPMPKTRS